MVTNNNNEAGQSLRRRAEDLLDPSVEEATSLLHELQVHQIELELQNEELRRSQQELDLSRARYFELYNFAPVGYLTINDNGLITKANLAAAALVLVTMKILIKRPFTQLIFPEDQDRYYHWCKAIMETGVSQVCELRLLKNDDSTIWVRLAGSLAMDAADEAELRVVVSDITEPKKVEVELATANQKIEEASKAKSVFLANMSHELRTPLNSIIGFSEVLQDQLFGSLNEKQETFVANILNSGRHLLSLINDILDISKVEASKMELELGGINMEELCQGTVAMFSEKARKQQIDLSYTVSVDLDGVTVIADGRKIKQILYNLVDNAIKFNRPRGFVAITVQKAGETESAPAVQIVVEDNGVGIAEADRERLFQPFSQLTQSSYDKQTEGTGLGLALTKRLVELHGGTIQLQGDLGQGCRFVITLPIRQE